MVGDVCTGDVTSVTVRLVVLTDTVVGPWVDVLTSGEVVVDCTVLTSGEVVVDCTEVEGCVTTVVPVVGDVCTVDVTSVTVGLVVLTDTVVGPWVDVLTSGEVVVSTRKVVLLSTVVSVEVVVDSTEVGGCVTTDV